MNIPRYLLLALLTLSSTAFSDTIVLAELLVSDPDARYPLVLVRKIWVSETNQAYWVMTDLNYSNSILLSSVSTNNENQQAVITHIDQTSNTRTTLPYQIYSFVAPGLDVSFALGSSNIDPPTGSR